MMRERVFAEGDELNLPTLNVQMISDLLTWAWADDQRLEEFMAKYPGWGSWNQGVWAQELRNGVCKTAYCMAGQTVAQSNFKLDLYLEDDVEEFDPEKNAYVHVRSEWAAEECFPVVKNGFDEKGNQKYKRSGENVLISSKAQEILGLDEFEANMFFDGANDLTRLVYLALAFAKARDVTLDISDEIRALAEIEEDPNFESISENVNYWGWASDADRVRYTNAYENALGIPALV